MTLRRKPSRINGLKRDVGDISQRMLSLTLRNIERDGPIKRTVTPSIPLRVEHEQAELGHSLSVSIQALGDWARAHLDHIEAAQARWDAGQSS